MYQNEGCSYRTSWGSPRERYCRQTFLGCSLGRGDDSRNTKQPAAEILRSVCVREHSAHSNAVFKNGWKRLTGRKGAEHHEQTQRQRQQHQQRCYPSADDLIHAVAHNVPGAFLKGREAMKLHEHRVPWGVVKILKAENPILVGGRLCLGREDLHGYFGTCSMTCRAVSHSHNSRVMGAKALANLRRGRVFMTLHDAS